VIFPNVKRNEIFANAERRSPPRREKLVFFQRAGSETGAPLERLRKKGGGLQNRGGFPLILTFSLREKEQPLVSFVKHEDSQAESRFSFTKTLGAFLPLPKGEGRGEGKPDAQPATKFWQRDNFPTK
jgi:hypothetical protein